jgi:hypothetical protein
LARTSLTRVAIGALDPTHGHAVEAACADCPPTTAVSDAAAATSVNPAISDLLTLGLLGLLGFPGRALSAAVLARSVPARRYVLRIGLFSMSAPDAKSFALKLK